ncbi:MAG: lyase family protein [bacterium]|nr:lyase family protein [bacterium]
MDPRYTKPQISGIWSDLNKLKLWMKTEEAVIRARVQLGEVDATTARAIFDALDAHPIDEESVIWWKNRDGKIHHDLNAFLEERSRFLPVELQLYFHQGITSYDTEESAFCRMLLDSAFLVKRLLSGILSELRTMALKYRYTIMNGRTHGQEAEMQTFGKRCLTWFKELQVDEENLDRALLNLHFSKLSGAIGNYGGLEPEVERVALKVLGFEPFYGSTQIMPRVIYTPLAQALCQIVLTLGNIAKSIRLGARSGRPLFHEPFAKMQKGSSAMPHKKNTIITEQIEGMGRMAKGYLAMIMDNITTWEERAIEQSCVERVAWPDLFHVTVHSLERMIKVLTGLVVYPDNMLREIIESRGCYASNVAKEFLKEKGEQVGLSAEDAYRIVQLAAFNAFTPSERVLRVRRTIPESFDRVPSLLTDIRCEIVGYPLAGASIEDIIREGRLFALPEQLEASGEQVVRWNVKLQKLLSQDGLAEQWRQLFQPAHLLRNEAVLYQKILGVE